MSHVQMSIVECKEYCTRYDICRSTRIELRAYKRASKWTGIICRRERKPRKTWNPCRYSSNLLFCIYKED